MFIMVGLVLWLNRLGKWKIKLRFDVVARNERTENYVGRVIIDAIKFVVFENAK